MKRAVYLDNAASSFPKPKAVARAVASAIDTWGGNPGRGVGKGTLIFDRLIFGARESIASLLNLPNPERIIFTHSATEGINIALKGLLTKGDSVAISGLEHNAVIRPLHQLKKKGVLVKHSALDKNGLPDFKRLDKTSMLVTTGGSNVTGAIANTKAIGKACKKLGVLFFVDAAQTAGSRPMDVSNIDILVSAGHKGLLGPQGTGFVWFRPGIEPCSIMEGGTGSESENPEMPPYFPDRLEPGTMNTPGIAGLKASVEWLSRKTIEAVQGHEIKLNKLILEALRNNPKIEVYPPYNPVTRTSLVTFNVKGKDPALIGDILSRRGIALRTGLHCAPEAHKFLGTFPGGGIRVSPGALTKTGDVKYFLNELNKIT